MDALDLAAVGEMAGDLGRGVVERLVLEELGQLSFGLAALARLFLAQALGFDALLFFLLRADGVGLGQVHLFLGARFRRPRASAALPRLRIAPARIRLAVAARFAGLGFRSGAVFAGLLAGGPAVAARGRFAAGLAAFAATLGARRALGPGFRLGRLEAQAQQFFAQGIAHRSCLRFFSSAAAAVLRPDPRTAWCAPA